MAPLVPRSHQGDANSVDFLHHAVLGYEWATEPLSRVATHDLSFQQLYGELAASLQLHTAAKRAKDRRLSMAVGPVKSELARVMFAGQGVYGRPKTGVGATSAAGPSRAVQRKDRFDPLSLMGCFNCDDPNHTMRDCSRPRDATRAAKRKLAYFSKKRAGTPALAGILFQLCQQVDTDQVPDVRAIEADAGSTSAALLEDNVAVKSRLYDELLVATATRGASGLESSAEQVEEVSFAPGV